MNHRSFLITLFFMINPALCLTSYGESPYEQQKNIVYKERDGIGLILDVFVPKGDKNGSAIIDIASGAWHSDRSKIRDHKLTRTYENMCKRGFVVFAIRPGSITRFSGKEMLENIHAGIKWVKKHSKKYSIDPDNLGLIGASAGGHLASLAALTADDSTRVKAVGVFFPPTDLVHYGKPIKDKKKMEKFKLIKHVLAFGPAYKSEKTPEELKSALESISPVYQVTESAPPFLIFHGDADKAVPLNQSKKLLAKFKEKGIPAELIIKKGGGHPWLTINEEVSIMADWLVEQLIKN